MLNSRHGLFDARNLRICTWAAELLREDQHYAHARRNTERCGDSQSDCTVTKISIWTAKVATVVGGAIDAQALFFKAVIYTHARGDSEWKSRKCE